MLEKDGDDQLDRSVKNEDVLPKVNEWSVLYTIKIRQVNRIGHSLHKKCFLKYFVEGKMGTRIEVTRRRERIHQQLLDDLKETRGCWKLREQVLCGEISLGKAMNLSQYRLCDDDIWRAYPYLSALIHFKGPESGKNEQHWEDLLIGIISSLSKEVHNMF